MQEFHTTRWGAFRLRAGTWLCAIGCLFVTGVGLWAARWAYLEESSGALFATGALFPLAVFLGLYGSHFFTQARLSCNVEGVRYTLPFRKPQFLPWEEITDWSLNYENWDIGPVTRFISDLELRLDRRRSGIFTPWPRTLILPLYAYTEPENIYGYVVGHLSSDDVNNGRPEPLPADALILLQEAYAHEQHALAMSRNPRPLLARIGSEDVPVTRLQHMLRQFRRKQWIYGILSSVGIVSATLGLLSYLNVPLPFNGPGNEVTVRALVAFGIVLTLYSLPRFLRFSERIAPLRSTIETHDSKSTTP